MKITYKLSAAFLLMTALLGIMGYASFANIKSVSESFGSVTQETLPVLSSLNELRIETLRIYSEAMEYRGLPATEGDAQNAEDASLQKIAEYEKGFNESFDKYGALVDTYFPDEWQLREEIRSKWSTFIANAHAAAAAKDGASHAFLRQQEFDRSKDDLLRILSAAIDSEREEFGERQDAVESALDGSLRNILIVIWIFVVMSFAGIFTAYRISSSVTELRDIAEKVGKGRFGAKSGINSHDELGELSSAFNRMTGEIRKSHDDISKKAGELERSKKDLEEKVRELQRGKSAILNMMEDAEELNRELIGAQEKLRKSVKELKETDIKKNEFMSIAAHELKTPMTSIHGFAQLLQNPEIAGNAEKRDKYLKIMDHETTRLAKLVTDVLDLSRIDLDTMKFDVSDVDVSQVIDTVRTELDVQITAKGLKSEYRIAGDLPAIHTDKERLTQILMNLINNSVKYTQKGKITVSAFREGNGVHFVILDTGIGISKKNQEKIFTRFYQVDSSYTRSGGGVGLGLSLCKEIVELLGGKIWFKSELDRGSEFHFTLPAKGPQR